MLRNTHQTLRVILLKGLLLGSVALLALGVLAPCVQGQSGDKVMVCHRPPGNPANFHIITVDPSAVDDHLAHGDNVVEPEACDDGVDNDCNGLVDNEDPACRVSCTECERIYSECIYPCQLIRQGCEPAGEPIPQCEAAYEVCTSPCNSALSECRADCQ